MFSILLSLKIISKILNIIYKIFISLFKFSVQYQKHFTHPLVGFEDLIDKVLHPLFPIMHYVFKNKDVGQADTCDMFVEWARHN